jgi:hypothetical protein
MNEERTGKCLRQVEHIADFGYHGLDPLAIMFRPFCLIVQYLSKTDHSKLRRTVLCQLVQSNESGRTSYVDNVAMVLSDH